MVTDNIIEANSAQMGGGIYLCCSAMPTVIERNQIINNTAVGGAGGGIVVHQEPAGTAFHHNIIQGNVNYGVYAMGTIDATHNWWGAYDGPGGAGPGSGDWVTADVVYEPWYEVILSVDDTSSLPGRMVSVAFSLDNQMDVCELNFTIYFDDANLGSPLLTVSERMSNMTVNAIPFPGGLNIMAFGPVPGIAAGTGEIMRLHFDLSMAVNAAYYPFSLGTVSTIDCDGADRYTLPRDGSLRVLPRFKDRWELCSGYAMGVAWGDVGEPGAWSHPDLDLDLAEATAFGESNRLFYQPELATPSDWPFVALDEFGLGNTNSAAWADYDNDGDLDLAVGNGNFESNEVYRNDGTSFTMIPLTGIITPDDTRGVAWGDYDNDADLDLAAANNGQNFIYRNDGNTFTQVAALGGGDSYGIVWADYDRDGDLDAAVANEGQNKLYVNQLHETGLPSFIEQDQFGYGSSRGMVWFDYDNDWDLDLAVTNAGEMESNRLYTNLLSENGSAGFDAGSDQFGYGNSRGIAVGDVDLDGDQDVAIVRGQYEYNSLFINARPLADAFAEARDFGTGYFSEGCAFGDYDGDGDLDLAVANSLSGDIDPSPGHSVLFDNQLGGGRYLKVRLRGGGFNPYSNRDGVGAIVKVYNNGAETPLGMRLRNAGSGYGSMDAPECHFGGLWNGLFDIEVAWPSGHTSLLWGVPPGATYLMIEGCADIDGNGNGPDIGDLVYLVTYMFQNGPPPPNMDAADINGDGTGPDIADLVYLVTYMFGGGPAPICHHAL